MSRTLPISNPNDPALATFAVDPSLPAFDASLLTHHLPDEHWLALGESGQITARLSLWHRATPPLPNEKLGLIGHYAASHADSAAALLGRAIGQLVAANCTLAVGPMDGNTWRRYRFVTEPGTEPPFFLEPSQPATWPGHFIAGGFSPLATYHSTLHTDLSAEGERVAEAAGRLANAGIRIRPMDPTRFEDELRRIYAVAAISFRSNYLYTPVEESEFLAQYAALRAHIRPELVLIAEDAAGQPIGFAFTLPDLLQAARGESIDTVIVKTVAVLPGHANAGLGSVLVGRAHAVANELGFRRAIHALMHEANSSRRVSARFSTEPLRRYTLFARRLS